MTHVFHRGFLFCFVLFLKPVVLRCIPSQVMRKVTFAHGIGIGRGVAKVEYVTECHIWHSSKSSHDMDASGITRTNKPLPPQSLLGRIGYHNGPAVHSASSPTLPLWVLHN